MTLIDLQDILIDYKFLNAVATDIEYNEDILDYYAVLKQEVSEKWDASVLNRYENYSNQKMSSVPYLLGKLEKTLGRQMNRLGECNQKWFMDVYDMSSMMDFQRTNLCGDKFCNNCKKVKQASRMSKYIPKIDQFTNNKKIHMVLTSPNVPGLELKDTIKQQFKAFSKLIEYLKGKKKIKGIDFESWGYTGAIRSLEVTYKRDSYHPHLHVLLLLEKKFDIGNREFINPFSYNRKKLRRRFTEKELIIQKIWYLLMNDMKVTLGAINNLEVGYSCMMDEFAESDYHELFKYMTKGNGSPNEDKDKESFIRYENFKTLYFALKSVRQIEGYGDLRGIVDDNIDDSFEEIYNYIIEYLRSKEKPRSQLISPRDLMRDIGQYRIISRKRIYAHLKQLQLSDEDN